MKFIFALAILFTVGTLYMLIKNPGERAPTIILKPSAFDHPEQLGVVLFRRFWSEVNNAPVIVLGQHKDLESSKRIWQGFLAAAQEYNLQNKKIIVIDINDFNWQELQKLPDKALIIFLSRLPVDDNTTNILLAECRANDPVFQISCQSLRAVSGRKKKKLDVSKYYASVEKLFDRLHLVYIYEGATN